jgi:hypothetical protein
MPEPRKTDSEIFAMQTRAAAAAAAASLVGARGSNHRSRGGAALASDVVEIARHLEPYIASGSVKELAGLLAE